MKLIALMPVRNEDWCLGLTLRAALSWCDAVVVLLHTCTDGSREIVEQVIRENDRGRVLVLYDSELVWNEMPQRQAMLECARRAGASHIAIVDADEILTGNLLQINMFGQGAIADSHCGVQPGSIAQMPGYNLRYGLSCYHANGVWGNRWFSLVFADDPALGWAGDHFHQREPGPARLVPYRPIQQGDGGILHLWGASERRLRAKHSWYKVTERLRWPDKPVKKIDYEYSLAIYGEPGSGMAKIYGTVDTWTYADLPRSWWLPYEQAGLMAHLHLDDHKLWQEQAVRDAVAKHGREMFAGLDLFGVDNG